MESRGGAPSEKNAHQLFFQTTPTSGRMRKRNNWLAYWGILKNENKFTWAGPKNAILLGFRLMPFSPNDDNNFIANLT